MTRDKLRAAGIAAGIPADVVDKLLGPGHPLWHPDPAVHIALRLVLDDGDTFHDADSAEGLGWSDWARAEHARGAYGDHR